MTPEEKQQLEKRWKEIDAELADLANGKVVDGDPAEYEQKLLGELDELEYKAGEEYFDKRDGD